MKIQIRIISQLGEFKGEIMEVSNEQYNNICEISKNYHESGFEMFTEDGGFLIIPNEIIKYSILKIDIL